MKDCSNDGDLILTPPMLDKPQVDTYVGILDGYTRVKWNSPVIKEMPHLLNTIGRSALYDHMTARKRLIRSMLMAKPKQKRENKEKFPQLFHYIEARVKELDKDGDLSLPFTVADDQKKLWEKDSIVSKYTDFLDDLNYCLYDEYVSKLYHYTCLTNQGRGQVRVFKFKDVKDVKLDEHSVDPSVAVMHHEHPGFSVFEHTLVTIYEIFLDCMGSQRREELYGPWVTYCKKDLLNTLLLGKQTHVAGGGRRPFVVSEGSKWWNPIDYTGNASNRKYYAGEDPIHNVVHLRNGVTHIKPQGMEVILNFMSLLFTGDCQRTKSDLDIFVALLRRAKDRYWNSMHESVFTVRAKPKETLEDGIESKVPRKLMTTKVVGLQDDDKQKNWVRLVMFCILIIRRSTEPPRSIGGLCYLCSLLFFVAFGAADRPSPFGRSADCAICFVCRIRVRRSTEPLR